MYVRFLCSASKETYTFAKICKRHCTLDEFRKNISCECSRKCFRDVVNLSLCKLLINAHMRDFWVLHELIHGMLRRLGSFLRCDDTLVDFVDLSLDFIVLSSYRKCFAFGYITINAFWGQSAELYLESIVTKIYKNATPTHPYQRWKNIREKIINQNIDMDCRWTTTRIHLWV